MRSLLDLPRDHIGDNKALNLILVLYGETEKVNEAVIYLQKAFRERIDEQSVSLYDDGPLYRAEFYPELLSKTNTLTFRKASLCDKSYIGYYDCRSEEKLNKLYSHLFSMPEEHFPILIPPNPPYYTQNRFLQLLSTPSESIVPDSDEIGTLGDFYVYYHYEKRNSEKSYATVRHYINGVCPGEDMTEPLSWFDSVIKELDEKFPDAFQSAYISYQHPNYAIVHKDIYHSYDIEALDRFVLGLEWSVYFSRRILQNKGMEALQGLADIVSVQQLQGGCQYKAREDIRQFHNSTRNKISRSLKDLLIPAYGSYCWYDVYEKTAKFTMYPMQTVSVYFDKFNPKNPTIIFSYNLDSDKIKKSACERGHSEDDLMVRFQRKADN